MKVTKAMLVAEARRVFGERTSVVLDARDITGRYWVCSVWAVDGVKLKAGSQVKARARRRLYDALRRLAPREGGE